MREKKRLGRIRLSFGETSNFLIISCQPEASRLKILDRFRGKARKMREKTLPFNATGCLEPQKIGLRPKPANLPPTNRRKERFVTKFFPGVDV